MRFSIKKIVALACVLVAMLGMAGCTSMQENIAALTAKAEKGDVKAMLALGDIYYGAQNTEWNETLGAKWMGMAAEHGHPRAQWSMGMAYSKGWGVPLDLVKSHTLSYQALCGGYSPAEKTMKDIEPLMSKKEIRQANEIEQQLPCASKK